MSVSLPAGAPTGTLPALRVRELAELVACRLDGTLGLVLCAVLLQVPDEPLQALLLLRDVEPVDGFGEPQVGVDAGDDDPGVDGDELDADQRHPHVRVEHEPLVQDGVDDVGEPRRLRALRVAAPWLRCDGHCLFLRSVALPAADGAERYRDPPRATPWRARCGARPRLPPRAGARRRPPEAAASVSSSPSSSCTASWSLTIWPSSITPRQPSTSSELSNACAMTWRWKCLSSSRVRRPCARQRLPVRSNIPCGWYSRTTTILVRLGA